MSESMLGTTVLLDSTQSPMFPYLFQIKQVVNVVVRLHDIWTKRMLLMNVGAGVLGAPLLKVREWEVHSLSFNRGRLRVSLIQLTVFRQETRYRNK